MNIKKTQKSLKEYLQVSGNFGFCRYIHNYTKQQFEASKVHFAVKDINLNGGETFPVLSRTQKLYVCLKYHTIKMWSNYKVAFLCSGNVPQTLVLSLYFFSPFSPPSVFFCPFHFSLKKVITIIRINRKYICIFRAKNII